MCCKCFVRLVLERRQRVSTGWEIGLYTGTRVAVAVTWRFPMRLTRPSRHQRAVQVHCANSKHVPDCLRSACGVPWEVACLTRGRVAARCGPARALFGFTFACICMCMCPIHVPNPSHPFVSSSTPTTFSCPSHVYKLPSERGSYCSLYRTGAAGSYMASGAKTRPGCISRWTWLLLLCHATSA